MDALRTQLGTNLGRYRYFRAYPFRAQEKLVKLVDASAGTSWVRLSNRRAAKVHGLTIEVPEYARSWKVIHRFGVSQDGSLPPGDQETVSPPPLPIHTRGPTILSPELYRHLLKERTGHGLSTASLDSIATLHVRKKILIIHNKRMSGCVGLRIAHHNSIVEILGRWDPHNRRSISRIYTSSEGFLTRISFHLATIGKAAHVENITLGVVNNPLDVQPLDSLSVVPAEPENHPWDSDTGPNSEGQTKMRTFDCSEVGQVSLPTIPCPFMGSKIPGLTRSQRVAWWFTFEYDDIFRDHGMKAIQVREADDLLDFGKHYEAVQIE